MHLGQKSVGIVRGTVTVRDKDGNIKGVLHLESPVDENQLEDLKASGLIAEKGEEDGSNL